MKLPADVADRIRAWVQSTPKESLHVDEEAARHGGISLMGTIGSTWLLRPDGTFWDANDDFGVPLRALPDEFLITALVAGSERHPWLSELLPERSPETEDCLDCSGSGRIRLNFPSDGTLYCASCRGLGWHRGDPP